MNTTTLQVQINTEYLPVFQSLFKQYKAKSQIIKEEKDDTKMTKEEYFAMIDEARVGKKTKATKQELLDMLYK